ncbi:HDOD domain-containing protein [Stutzerimonas sp. NM35]
MRERAKYLLTLLQSDIAANRLILPSLPEVGLRVRLITLQENCTLGELEREIATDPALAARLVKVASSSVMRRGVPVSSLKQAIAGLGFDLVRLLVSQLAILQTMKSTQGDKVRLRGFVASGSHISALCRALSAPFPHLDAELATLGGLLHDIGKLPLRDFLQRQENLTPIERLHFELMLHPHVGAMMLRQWKVSEELVQMARGHESILRETGQPLPDYVDLVIAANLLHYGVEKGRYARFAGLDIPALRKCTGGTHTREDAQRADECLRMAQLLACA